MPAGYWGSAWAVFWQSTLINSIILIASYWIRMPTSGYSIFMPIAAPVNVAALAIASILIGSLIGYIASFHSAEWAVWAASAGFAFVYGMYCFYWRANYESDVTRGIDGFQIGLAIVAIGIWWLRVIEPLVRRNT